MNKKFVAISLFVAAVLLLLTACGPSSPTPAASGGGKGIVYYMAPELLDEFQVGTNKDMVQYGTEMGYEVRALNGGNNTTTQINQMDDAITQKPVAIILNAVDASTVTGEVEKIRAAGIPVLVYDRFVQNTEVDFHSVVGTIKIGQMAADEVAKALKEKNGSEKGTVLELLGDPGDSYSVLIDQGFSEAIKQYPDIQVIVKPTPAWDVTTSASIVDDQLTANPEIDALFVHGDFRIPAITPVLEAHGLNKGDMIIIGTDGAPTGLQAIRDGWMKETIGVPMNQQVYAIWQFMGDIIAKKSLQPGTVDVQGVQAELKNEEWGPTLYLPGQIVDQSNVDDAGNWGNMKVDSSSNP